MTDAISVKNLTKRYGETVAVDDISFAVPTGDFYGFLGPNGAGKTTTMRILATLEHQTSGTALVQGFDNVKQADAVRKSIGFALQGVSVDQMASAVENLILIGKLYGLTAQEAKQRADELLELFGLAKVAHSWVKNFSGGMRRRLDLAVVMMHEPPLLFLDEPTEGLDPAGRRVIWDKLIELNKKGSTIFLTTHFMDEADALCRNLSIIDKGKIVVTNSPQALKDEVRGTLEDVFIHYTGHGIRDEELNTKAADPYIRS